MIIFPLPIRLLNEPKRFLIWCNQYFQDSAVRVTNSLVNIRAITAHFSPKIDAWLSQQQLSTPSEEQILDVVKANYDSLTLKLQVTL